MKTVKILILETRKLSYNSSGVFLSNICTILKEYGVDVTHCIINNPEKDSTLLESFIGKSFDAVLDVNSILPLAECDYGRYLDCIDAPFINFIVDHPMHVHEYLNIKLKRYYVICIDKYHKEYIEKYYPHIIKTVAIPLGGIKANTNTDIDSYSYSQFKKRKYHIFFPATYTPPSYYRQVMEENNISYIAQAEQILQEILDGRTAPIHELYKSITSWKDERFALRMYKARFIDRYIRDYIRDKVVEALLLEGFKLDVAGARWEMYNSSGKDRLIIHKPYSYTELPSIMSNAKIVLNVQPLFTEAPHDRVFNAMLNGAAVLTDTCSYIEKNYKDSMLIYDKGSLKESISALKDTLNDTHKLYTMVKDLRQTATDETWEDRCRHIVEFVENII